jgi:hypothetical protein
MCHEYHNPSSTLHALEVVSEFGIFVYDECSKGSEDFTRIRSDIKIINSHFLKMSQTFQELDR